ncbi:MAG TPA: ABC transporter ATP-binding protein [Opitutaceae bacterium]|nr:ABC transporter ATP-binding protein [Opitutaceae bacterium]
MSIDPVITVENLGKRYTLHHQAARGSLREKITSTLHAPVRWLRSKSAEQPATREEFWALREVNFSINRGEVVGIIGRNGAGKSTLLKILSRITEPTTGWVTLRGRVASLLEVGTGFHPELTGRENIFLNGAILGMGRAEIRRKFDEIIAFAEVEKFLDTPVKYYSSGMYVRLAFAVAAHLEPEILIIDEVLAVGDAAFQQKCLGKIGAVARGGRTVLFVSHNMGAVQNLCSRAILLASGRVVEAGPTRQIVARYLEFADQVYGQRTWSVAEAPNDGQVLRVMAIRVTASDGSLAQIVPVEQTFQVEIDYEILAPVSRLWVGFTIETASGDVVFCAGDQNFSQQAQLPRGPGRYRSRCTVPANLLNEDHYTLSLLSHIPGIREVIRPTRALQLNTVQRDAIAGGGRQPGFVRPVLDWTITPLPSSP